MISYSLLGREARRSVYQARALYPGILGAITFKLHASKTSAESRLMINCEIVLGQSNFHEGQIQAFVRSKMVSP